MNLKLLLLIFSIFLIPFFFISQGFSDEQELESLIIETEGWCIAYPITLKAYNESEYNIRTQIIADRDRDFTNLQGMDIRVYNGPLEGLGVLSTGKLSSSNEFSYTFSREGNYLIRLLGNSRFEGKNLILEVINCNRNPSSSNNSQSPSQDTNLEQPQINREEFLLGRINIEFEGNQSNLSVRELQVSELVENNFEEVILAFEILNLELLQNFKVSIPELSNDLSLYKFDEENRVWVQLQSDIDSGGFYLLSNTPLNSAPKISEEETYLEDSIFEETSEIPVVDSRIENSLIQASIIIFLGMILMLVLSLLVFNIRKKTRIARHSENDEEYHKSQDEMLRRQEIKINTKNYIKEHSNNYPMEKIKEALQNAKVPEDIINEAIVEISKEK